MRILKIWIFQSQSGQPLFFKEYENLADNIVSNLLNTSILHSFINFFNSHLVLRNCDLILFDEILFTFHYMEDTPFKFTTLLVTRIDKKIDFEVQSKVLQKVATNISREFHDCYKEVMEEIQHNLTAFEPFGERCDILLHKLANEIKTIKLNGF